jgi:hypothetical protein
MEIREKDIREMSAYPGENSGTSMGSVGELPIPIDSIIVIGFTAILYGRV